MELPRQLIDRHFECKSMVGGYEMLGNFSFSGMLYEQAELFADKVMPRLKA